MLVTLVGAGRTRHLTKLLPLAVGLLPCKPQQAPAHAPPLLCSAVGTEEYKSFSLAILSVVTEVGAYACPFVSWSVEQNDGVGEALFFQGCFPGDQSTLTPLANTVLVICIISENFEKYCSLGFFLISGCCGRVGAHRVPCKPTAAPPAALPLPFLQLIHPG